MRLTRAPCSLSLRCISGIFSGGFLWASFFFYFLISVPRKYLGRRWAVAMAFMFLWRAIFLLFKLSKARSLRQRRLPSPLYLSHHPWLTPRENCESPTRLSAPTSRFPLEHFSAIKKRSPRGHSRIPAPHRLAPHLRKGLTVARGARSVRRRATTRAPIICPDGQ